MTRQRRDKIGGMLFLAALLLMLAAGFAWWSRGLASAMPWIVAYAAHAYAAACVYAMRTTGRPGACPYCGARGAEACTLECMTDPRRSRTLGER
jgi:hypothetical protein